MLSMVESEVVAKSARAELLDIVERIGPALAAENHKGETNKKLPTAAVKLLRDSKLLELKAPRELGGWEADNAVQFEVFEALAKFNAAAAWCYFIYADALGKVCAHLPTQGLEMIMANGMPTVCGGGGFLLGTLEPAKGGFRLSGSWIYGSGIDGADYVLVPASIEGQPAPFFCVVPKCDIQLKNNWDPVGMRGTGSGDYYADNVFVPEALVFSAAEPPRRGGAMFLLGHMGYVAHTIPAVAVGVAQKALDNLVEVARSKVRGYQRRSTLADRAVFQAFVGRSNLRLAAMRLLMLDVGQRIVAEAVETQANPESTEIELRAASCLATETAAEIVSDVLRYSGGTGSKAGSLIEQAFRDVHMAQTHFIASDSSVETYGQSLLGLSDADVRL